jgi:two-component system CheB/CheR fusion protein
MTRLIDDLLDVTRVSRGKVVLHPSRVELTALARATADDHRGTFASSGVELEVVDLGKPVWVDGDGTRLAQVLGNILTNSAKFTPRGGKTRLTVDANASEAVLRVRDTGVGWSAETEPHLFDRFVQAAQSIDRSRGGLGLGLALVKGLVELHHGTVTGHSDGPGRGSEFVVTLPLAQTATASEVSSEPTVRAPRRVLVIEDNVDSAETLRDALSLDGHEVTVAFSGPDGLGAARASHPDVVICDLGLPGLDGYEFARSIRDDSDTELRSAFLIALSGYASPQAIAKSKEAGFDQHIAKPPGIEALEAMIEQAPPRRWAQRPS